MKTISPSSIHKVRKGGEGEHTEEGMNITVRFNNTHSGRVESENIYIEEEDIKLTVRCSNTVKNRGEEKA